MQRNLTRELVRRTQADMDRQICKDGRRKTSKERTGEKHQGHRKREGCVWGVDCGKWDNTGRLNWRKYFFIKSKLK